MAQRSARSHEIKSILTFYVDTWNDAAVKAAWDENTPAEAKPYIIYGASKTEGERAAWNWVKENKPGFAFNAVLPNLVVSETGHLPFSNLAKIRAFCSICTNSLQLGRVLHPNINGSTMKWVAGLLEGDASVLSMLPPRKASQSLISSFSIH